MGLADAQRTFFIIIGLPRSGTSCIAQFLEQLGVYFGDPTHFVDTNKFKHNPNFYELRWVNIFNDRLVGPHASAMDDYLPSEEDFARPELTPHKELLKAQLKEEFGNRAVVGVKDPRICFTFPIWKAAATEMGYQIKTIFTLRCPSAVLKSNRMIASARLAHWQRNYAHHLLAARHFTRDLPVCYFDYDKFMQDPPNYGKKMAGELGLQIPDSDKATRHVSRELYHFQPNDIGTGDPWVDRVDEDFRAGKLDPNEYVTYRNAALLFIPELRALETEERLRKQQDEQNHPAYPAWDLASNLTPNPEEKEYRELQKLKSFLMQGGRFLVESQPDGTVTVRQVVDQNVEENPADQKMP